MRIVHGTSLKNAESIMSLGILPRLDGKSQWKVSSCENAVYFSNAYALHFAMNSSDGADSVAFIEIDSSKLSEGFLVSDEDVLEQAFRIAKIARGKMFGSYTEKLSKMNMETRTKWFSRRLLEFKEMGFDQNWSLNLMGTCAYIGSVPKEAITKIAVIKNVNTGWWLKFFDPTITIMNYRFLGDMYRSIQSLMLGNYEIILENAPPKVKPAIMALEKEISPNRDVLILR